MGSVQTLMYLLTVLPLFCRTVQTTAPIRLAGGPNNAAGRVEILHGAWGIVCDDGWGINDAKVVCRQLGFSGALEATTNSKYGFGNGQHRLDDVGCTGSETSLDRCTHRGWNTHDCGNGEAAGVVCRVNGGWNVWSTWGTCSLTCGGGTQTRTKACTNPSPLNGGANCVGNGRDQRNCNTAACPVNGDWNTWSSWEACSLTRGGGRQTRTRTCTNPAPQHGGVNCVGTATAQKNCNHVACPVNGNWSTWSNWTMRSATCGGGLQSRVRSCDNQESRYGGSNCSGNASETQGCGTLECPVNGNWSQWSNWTTCSATCGGGLQSRVRSCDNPAPLYGGTNCSGNATEIQMCGTFECPVNGSWSEWSNWTPCNATCSGGMKSRTRSCDNPAPSYGGTNCSGNTSRQKMCATGPCPIDGGWSQWLQWSSCSATCGRGTQSRIRLCDHPTPVYAGSLCDGDPEQESECHILECQAQGTTGLQSGQVAGITVGVILLLVTLSSLLFFIVKKKLKKRARSVTPTTNSSLVRVETE